MAEVRCGGEWWRLYVFSGGYGVEMGARSYCMLGGRIEWDSIQLVAMVVKKKSFQQQLTIHLAINQAWFSLSSQVLLVSTLKRSAWKCTVKRFINRIQGKSNLKNKSPQIARECMSSYVGYLRDERIIAHVIVERDSNMKSKHRK